jgi:uroporphyrin-III C-methyltransferase/precorrin-2 dehydrogenase/sirohydrochlorin ferrochelatase
MAPPEPEQEQEPKPEQQREPDRERGRERDQERLPVYLSGLLLAARRVVVVGGGTVAHRRVTGLLDAGAQVVVVAPELVPRLRELVHAGRVSWQARPYRDGDLDGAWYAVTATGDPDVDAAVVVEAEQRRVFCVHAGSSREGSALTPASGAVRGLIVGVLSTGAQADPRRAAAARSVIVAAVEAGLPGIPPA